jgi:pyruvate dehydrogenase E2 component (dihydrolipoamide acetyltransferase)
MASEIKLPELGENLAGGEVLDIKVSAGDQVAQGQTLLEVEAEKSTVEVPAPFDGKVTQVLVKKGDSIKVGQTLCLIEGGNGVAKAAPAPARQTQETEANPRVTPGVKRRDSSETRTQDGTVIVPPQKAIQPAEDGQKTEAIIPPPATDKPVPAGPATRQLARDLGVDLQQVRGTAPGGRVTQEDVKSFVRELASKADGRSLGIAVPPLPDFARFGPIERRPLDSVRRRTAEQMSLAWSLIPHVTQHDLADITDLDAFRRQQEGKGPRLTVTAFALKAAAIALKQFPSFNGSLDTGAGQLILKSYYHIGVAVDTERGLLVPVLRDVDKKSVRELALEVGDIAERARQKKISADDMRGGTFTITNLGGIGGVGFTPIVNYPEVAILGLSRARLQPEMRDGQMVPRLMLPVSVSYDHRVIDGADAARFTRRIAEMLQNPLLML